MPSMSPFSPFDVFLWNSGDTPNHPVGQSDTEADDVAWLMTIATQLCCSEMSKVVDSLAYAVHIRRNISISDKLYRALSVRPHRLVHVREIEGAIGCTWSEINVNVGRGETKNIDPYFWKLYENLVRDSIKSYLADLDVSVLKLKGCEAGQTCSETEVAMERVRRATAHCLANALLDRTTTLHSLVDTLTSLRNGWIQEHSDAAKTRMQESVRRVRAFARVVASADDKFEEALQAHEVDLQMLFTELPLELCDELEQRNISILEVKSVFSLNSNGLLSYDSNVPPTSFAVRASMLGRWLARCSDAVSEACVTVIAMMRRAADLPALSPEWTNVQLHAASQRSNFPASLVAKWSPPVHLDAGDEALRILVAEKTHHYTGLRMARVFAVLLQQARLGLLPALTARAGLLVPIVARFGSESQVSYTKFVNTWLRPVAEQYDCTWPEDSSKLLGKRPRRGSTAATRTAQSLPQKSRALACGSPAAVQFAPPGVTTLPVTAKAPTLPVATTGTVPPELLRDHCILHGLALCMQSRQRARSVQIALDEIVKSVRGVAPSLRCQADASLKQAVRWVCCRVIERANAQLAQDGEPSLTMAFDSGRDRAYNGRTVGVVCEGEGVSYLFRYVIWCVNEMRYNGAVFRGVWHTSKSAMSKAAAANKKITSHKPGVAGCE